MYTINIKGAHRRTAAPSSLVLNRPEWMLGGCFFCLPYFFLVRVYVREITLIIRFTNKNKSVKLTFILPTPFRIEKGVGNMNVSLTDLFLFVNLIINVISLTYTLTRKK